MLFINQKERRASDTVLSTSENNDIANQSVDTSFFTSEKNRVTNQLAYLDAFWRVNLGMYITKEFIQRSSSHRSKNKVSGPLRQLVT